MHITYLDGLFIARAMFNSCKSVVTQKFSSTQWIEPKVSSLLVPDSKIFNCILPLHV